MYTKGLRNRLFNMIEPINSTDNISQVIPEKELNNTPYYLSDDFERSPNGDVFDNKKKKTKRIILTISGILAATIITVGAICYSKGKSTDGTEKKFGERIKDGWKKLWEKNEKQAGEIKDKAPERPSEGSSKDKPTETKTSGEHSESDIEKVPETTGEKINEESSGILKSETRPNPFEPEVQKEIKDSEPVFIHDVPPEITTGTEIIKVDDPHGIFEEFCNRYRYSYKGNIEDYNLWARPNPKPLQYNYDELVSSELVKEINYQDFENSINNLLKKMNISPEITKSGFNTKCIKFNYNDCEFSYLLKRKSIFAKWKLNEDELFSVRMPKSNEYIDFIFDKNGNCTANTYEKGKLYSTEKFNSKKELTSCIRFDENKKPSQEYYYKYDDAGNCIEKEYNDNDSWHEKHEYTYEDNILVSEIYTDYDSNNAIFRQKQFKYKEGSTIPYECTSLDREGHITSIETLEKNEDLCETTTIWKKYNSDRTMVEKLNELYEKDNISLLTKYDYTKEGVDMEKIFVEDGHIMTECEYIGSTNEPKEFTKYLYDSEKNFTGAEKTFYKDGKISAFCIYDAEDNLINGRLFEPDNVVKQYLKN